MWCWNPNSLGGTKCAMLFLYFYLCLFPCFLHSKLPSIPMKWNSDERWVYILIFFYTLIKHRWHIRWRGQLVLKFSSWAFEGKELCELFKFIFSFMTTLCLVQYCLFWQLSSFIFLTMAKDELLKEHVLFGLLHFESYFFGSRGHSSILGSIKSHIWTFSW